MEIKKMQDGDNLTIVLTGYDHSPTSGSRIKKQHRWGDVPDL